MRFFRDLTQRPRNDAPAGEPVVERESLAHTSETLADVSRELASWVPILRRLAEAEALRDLALGQYSEINGAAVRSIISARRLRDQYFWPSMSEAAWALMLELFANSLEGERVDAAALGAATDMPRDSALHWIDWLAGRNMVLRDPEAETEEAALVTLTEAGADEMRAYLLASLRLSPWVQ